MPVGTQVVKVRTAFVAIYLNHFGLWGPWKKAEDPGIPMECGGSRKNHLFNENWVRDMNGAPSKFGPPHGTFGIESDSRELEKGKVYTDEEAKSLFDRWVAGKEVGDTTVPSKRNGYFPPTLALSTGDIGDFF